MPAWAAVPDTPASQATWLLLAATGLAAVAVAGWRLRHRADDDARRDDTGPGLLREVPAADGAAAPTPVVDAPAQDAPEVPAGASAPLNQDERGDLPVVAAAPTPATAEAALPAAIRRRRPDRPDFRVDAPASVSPLAPDDERPDFALRVPIRPNEGPVAHGALPAAAADPDDGPLLDQPPPSVVRRRTPATVSQPFLALHHVDLSIDMLRRHIAGEQRPMPAVWVMLLDLCRTHGREAAFREIAADFHARFNVCTPAWDTYPPGRREPGLEAYPRIVKELTLAWGTHECPRLLDRLLYDNRQGGRRGFTMNAYNDLIALRRAADAVLASIEQDFAEESKLRDAFARAAADAEAGEAPHDAPADASPLVRDLESQLDADLREPGGAKSALEREHPALVDALSRDWGNAALAGRLCEMLARGDDGRKALSAEARDDVELLRGMAERMAAVNGIALAAD